MLTIRLTTDDLMPEADRLEGVFLDERHYDRVVRDRTTTVLKPNGEPLVILVKNALPRRLCETAYDVFRRIRDTTANRATAAGLPRERPIKADGTRSRTAQTAPVASAVVGYLDRAPRLPACRLTAFTRKHFQEFRRTLPYVRALDRVFREHAPDRCAAQHAFVSRVSRDFVIPGTTFSTLTVNRTFRTAAHRDAGDLRQGFGVMSVLNAGADYDGFELVYPAFRAAVDVRVGDVLLSDVHELHGNAPVRRQAGRFERVSVIAYVREGMAACGSAAEEARTAS